jgi:hypothetical protein
MRRIVLAVGIGAGLFGMATLHNTDSMAVELVRKTNFNLPKLVLPTPAPADLAMEPDKPGDPAVPSTPTRGYYSDYSDHRLVLKKNFNLSKLVAAYPNEKVISVDLADPNPYDGRSPNPTDIADEPHDDYYRPPVMFPLPNGGNDHADSPDRTAGNDRRRSPRP